MGEVEKEFARCRIILPELHSPFLLRHIPTNSNGLKHETAFRGTTRRFRAFDAEVAMAFAQ